MKLIEARNSDRPAVPADWRPEQAFASPDQLGLLNRSRDSGQPDRVRQRAKEDLIRANRGLVTKWTAPWAGTSFGDDVVQAGLWALSRSIDRFDPGVGVRFSSYATRAVKNAVSRELGEHWSSIRLPTSVRESINRTKQVTRRIESRLGRPADDHDLCAALGCELVKLEELRSHDRLAQSVVSLSAALDRCGQNGSVRELADVVPDTSAISPEAEMLAGERQDFIRASCNRLPERQRQIIVRVYGLDGQPEQTFASVIAGWGMKRSQYAARSIWAKAHQTLAYVLPRLAELDPVDRQLASRLGLAVDQVVFRRRFVGLLEDFALTVNGHQSPVDPDRPAGRLVELDRGLADLEPGDREVIDLWAGLGREWPHTCWEIGQRFELHQSAVYNISQRGCRQIMSSLGLAPPNYRVRIDFDRDRRGGDSRLTAVEVAESSSGGEGGSGLL